MKFGGLSGFSNSAKFQATLRQLQIREASRLLLAKEALLWLLSRSTLSRPRRGEWTSSEVVSRRWKRRKPQLSTDYSEAPSATRKRRTLKHHHAQKYSSTGEFSFIYNTIIVRKLIYEQKSRQGVQQ